MDAVTTSADTQAATLPADLRLGPVHLTVPDVERAVDWYARALGLVTHRQDAADAELGDGSEIVLVLHEDRDAAPAGRHAGLYHYALLYPDRRALAHAVMRLASTQTPIQGVSDHGTHEAIYLPDADGNGIELAADRPREQWPRLDMYSGGPAPLDVESLLEAGAGEPPPETVAEGLRVGHMHLHVGDIDESLAFYRDTLGFEEQANLGSAAFVSAGGYHHHLGFNVWRGRGVGPAPPHTVGLREWTVVLPTEADVDAVRKRAEAAGAPVDPYDGGFLTRDPSQTAVVFVAAG